MDMNIKNYGLILLTCISVSLNPSNLIFLENESNATIAYQVNDIVGQEYKLYGKKLVKRDVQYINHGVRHLLGNISPMQQAPQAFVKTLKISGSWMWSRYTSLEEYLKEIRAEQKTACDLRGSRCYQNAIITIKPSGISGWNITHRWEMSGKIQEFEME